MVSLNFVVVVLSHAFSHVHAIVHRTETKAQVCVCVHAISHARLFPCHLTFARLTTER